MAAARSRMSLACSLYNNYLCSELPGEICNKLKVIIHSERCCYWYQRVPGNNSDCHVSEGGTAVLTCGVFAPRDNNSKSNSKVVQNHRICGREYL